MSFRNCHLVVGGLGLLLFVLQGQYMARVLGVEHLLDAPRMMYRSAHIYFMLACAANVCVGYCLAPKAATTPVQRIAGVLLLIAPALLLYSFFAESTSVALERPVAQMALYLLFATAVLLLLHEVYRRLRARFRNR